MHVERGKFADLILSFFGKRWRGLRLEDAGVTILGPRERRLGFGEIASPTDVKNGLPFSSVTLPLTDGSSVSISGLAPSKAHDVVAALNEAWRGSIRAQIEAWNAEITALHQVVARLSAPRRYPAACLLEPYLARTRALFASLPRTVPQDIVPAEQARILDTLAAFDRNPALLRDQAIETFFETELQDMSGFFERIQLNPLTPEQRLAVMTDEDATLVLAGAGSGKTSVIVAKAAYLIEREIRRSDEILLMAFGKDAAAEMSKRIEKRCGAPVTASTFHALAYGIIREVEGQAPALATHASDDAQFLALLRQILSDQAAKLGKAADLLIRWFGAFFWPYRSEWEFRTKHEYYRYIEEHELRTLQGERVRSFEELEIANWLYLNGIAYEYEPNYEHPLPENDRRAYTPDFRLKDSGAYIEHFGVRKERNPDGTERLTTAPYVNCDSYLESMAWKRQVHAEHGTTLIETYSYEQVEGRLTTSLAEKLKPHVVLAPLPLGRVFERLAELGQIDAFTQMLGTFLRHFKGAGLSVDDCRRRNEGLESAARGNAFLEIFEPVLAEYQRRLGPRIDFEDMITRATGHVRSGRFRSPYRHLLVDEFQDISQGRRISCVHSRRNTRMRASSPSATTGNRSTASPAPTSGSCATLDASSAAPFPERLVSIGRSTLGARSEASIGSRCRPAASC